MYFYDIFTNFISNVDKVDETAINNIRKLEVERKEILAIMDLESTTNSPLSTMSIIRLQNRLKSVDARIRKNKLVLSNIEKASNKVLPI